MSPALSIRAGWERLDEGSAEERACFGAVGITCNGISLARGIDGFVDRARDAPLVSAYHLAEWLAWNWWRQRWEPQRSSIDWRFAHEMTSVGEGYVWPNITVVSDGVRVALVAKPSRDPSAMPITYIANRTEVVPASDFTAAVDDFVSQVIGQLLAKDVGRTGLEAIWRDRLAERSEPEAARRRRMEALLGYEPDESDDLAVTRLLHDAHQVGGEAVDEIAAAPLLGGSPLDVAALRELLPQAGFRIQVGDAAGRITSHQAGDAGTEPAWRAGAATAAALRARERLGTQPLSDARLAELAGADAVVIRNPRGNPPISFALDDGAVGSWVVLRSRWREGRRFELARLLGDRLTHGMGDRLFPATRAYTYRQKMQRSFAAELLSPYDAVEDMLGGDYSPESREEVAQHFHVSELTIRTLLVNHRRLGRDHLEDSYELAAT